MASADPDLTGAVHTMHTSRAALLVAGLAFACGSKDEGATEKATTKVEGAFEDAQRMTARVVIKELADAHLIWQVSNPGETCPADLAALAPYLSGPPRKDPWGNDYVVFCGDDLPEGAAGEFGALSKGPDGVQGTDDDVKSWE